MQCVSDVQPEGCTGKEVILMIAKLAHAIQKVAELLLTGILVGTQVGNILICLASMVFGIGVVISFMPPKS